MSALPADLMTEVVPLAGTKDTIVTQWTGLNPPVEDFIQVVPLRAPSTEALRAYAGQLTVTDRTTLWLSGMRKDNKFLSAIGEQGVSEDVYTAILPLMVAATSEADRTLLAERALTARPADASARRALSELVLTLLSSNKRVDGPLAARLALHMDEVPYGLVTRLRDAFDAHVSLENHRLTQRQMEALRARRLLSQKNRKGSLSRVALSVGRRGRK